MGLCAAERGADLSEALAERGADESLVPEEAQHLELGPLPGDEPGKHRRPRDHSCCSVAWS